MSAKTQRCCPRCASPFDAAADLGVCPKCGLWFRASRPLRNEHVSRVVRNVFWTVFIVALAIDLAVVYAANQVAGWIGLPAYDQLERSMRFPARLVAGLFAEPYSYATRREHQLFIKLFEFGGSALSWALFAALIVWGAAAYLGKRRALKQ